MSNEKDTNDPTADDPDEPPRGGVDDSSPAGNGEDAERGDPEPDDGPANEPGADEDPVTDSRGESAADPDDEDDPWDDGVVVDDGDGFDDADVVGEGPDGGRNGDAAEPADDGDIDELGSTVEVEGAEIEEDPDEDDLLGGLKIDTTAEIEIPDRLVDQVIGQEHARDVIIKAAKQRRHVMMIGSPGTGKSMLAKAMSELLPKEELQDVLVYHNPDDGNKPKVRTVPAGKGDQIVEAHREEARKRNQMRSLLMWIIIAVVLGYALIIVGQILVGIIA
ncbi:ATP-binding protein, partial [Haloarcula sp. AONF1]